MSVRVTPRKPEEHERCADPRGHREEAAEHLALGGARPCALVAPGYERARPAKSAAPIEAASTMPGLIAVGRMSPEAERRAARARDEQRGRTNAWRPNARYAAIRAAARRDHQERGGGGERGEDAEQHRGRDEVVGHRRAIVASRSRRRAGRSGDRSDLVAAKRLATAYAVPERRADRADPVEPVRGLDRGAATADPPRARGGRGSPAARTGRRGPARARRRRRSRASARERPPLAPGQRSRIATSARATAEPTSGSSAVSVIRWLR